MSILIGLTGWGDHQSLYQNANLKQHKLMTYSSHFPVVEIDSSFYAIQPEDNYQKWSEQTPKDFSFVVKAFQTLTGHDRQALTNGEMKQLVKEFTASLGPLVETDKLNTILLQFPPWFRYKHTNMERIKKLVAWIGDLPVTIEFRNRTWYGSNQEHTLKLLQSLAVTHAICDEPQAGEGSVPTVLKTSNNHALIRFHGRNVYGWNNHGQENWREVRFLYRYNKQELTEWAEHIQLLEKQTKDITILFNNNSGGDAADNAKQLIDLLGITYTDLHPKQIDLFDLF